jgi:hypothetical protein
MTIPLGPTLPPGSSGLPVPPAPVEHESGPPSTASPPEGRDAEAGPIWPCSGWGLPSRHVTMPLVRSYRTISPLPTGPRGRESVGGIFSVALSVRSPSLGVTQHPALRSPDFPLAPPPRDGTTSDHPTDFGHLQRSAQGDILQPRGETAARKMDLSMTGGLGGARPIRFTAITTGSGRSCRRRRAP